MKLSNKIKVIALMMMIIAGLMVSTKAYAQEYRFFAGDFSFDEEEGEKHLTSFKYGEDYFTCIGKGAAIGANLTRELFNQYNNVNTYGLWCDKGELVKPAIPWAGSLKYAYYPSVTRLDINTTDYQKVAYIVAESIENWDGQGDISTLLSSVYRSAIWATDLNDGNSQEDNALSSEAENFQTFYEKIHDDQHQDIFSDLIKDKTKRKNVEVAVNQEEGSYTVGPFKVNFPTGGYTNTDENINVKFSWISKVTAVTDVGNLEVQVLDKNGKLYSNIDKDGNQLNVPDSGDEFYVKFYSTTAKTLEVKIDFEYLESCEAELYKLTGYNVSWQWGEEFDSIHYHTEYVWDEGSKQMVPIQVPYNTYHYRLAKNDGSTIQPLLMVKTNAKKIYKKTSVTIPSTGGPIDLTMKIAGTVFIDRDTGKVNEGNNKLDEGEILPGAEVRLYDANNKLIGIKLTNKNGHYEFSNLNSMKKYYVKFTYNGMLYTNVERLKGNAEDISKATEQGQGHDKNRINFNNKFQEIGSYPANYKTKDCITGEEIYNRTYLQEEIADLFKQITEEMILNKGNEKAVYQMVINRYKGSDPEIQYKVQFIADCRISAYTTEKYPLLSSFVISDSWAVVAGVRYEPIYGGAYDQLHVNLGIKARETFDLALYQDVFNAVVEVNGKSETYTYDARKDKTNKGFNFGVNEQDYINQLRDKYINNKATTLESKEVSPNDEYTQEMRSEEIVNGTNSNGNINANSLFDSNGNYAWRDINHQLTEQDKLKIHVTYKLAIRNQSGVIGAVTEVVNYYDNNYVFESAYLGKEDGTRIDGSVAVSETSKYANRNSSLSPNNTMYSTNGKYKTIYLRPTETKLGDGEEQYIFVTFTLNNPETTLINAGLLSGQNLYTHGLSEITGYKTYGKKKSDTQSLGLIDKDSNPGNLNPATYERGVTPLEDDESQAPAFIYSKRYSRTLEGIVFEDMVTSIKNADTVATGESRFGNGSIDNNDKKIKGVIVELVEIKQVNGQNQMIVRQATRTDENGWYGFGAFLPGDYVIRYTYGADNQTAMTTNTPNITGANDTSYNGQDYQSTSYNTAGGQQTSQQVYQTDAILQQRYEINNSNRNPEETVVSAENTQAITKYNDANYYWYHDNSIAGRNDATDDAVRRSQVMTYSTREYGTQITNHKAEVFGSYENPQPEHITADMHRKLVSELERRTYRYAYTAEIPVEIEYTKKTVAGNQGSNHYEYKITGVDFGVVERPKAKLEIEKKVDHIKVIAADGVTVLFDTSRATNNLAWTVKRDRYTTVPPIQIFMDDELISGAKLEITYKFTITNKGESDANGNSITRAKKIIDYVANNLTYTAEDGENSLWQVVSTKDIQKDSNATLINNTQNGQYKLIDISTKQTILQTTEQNPLTKALKPGESASTTLVLKKVLSAESSTDDLTYRNITEIVEIENTVGRYDHSSTPGNQAPDASPTEDDTYEAENVVVLPPFGAKPTYYVIGMVVAILLAGGIYLIKRKVIDHK